MALPLVLKGKPCIFRMREFHHLFKQFQETPTLTLLSFSGYTQSRTRCFSSSRDIGLKSSFCNFSMQANSANMVTLVVATTIDPASIGPASALLAMSSEWRPGPTLPNVQSFVHGRVRLLKQEKGILEEDDLDKRWEELTEETVQEVIFLSKHKAASTRPALTVHPIGTPHAQSPEECTFGGKPGWAGPPCPRIGPWLKLMKEVADDQKLTPEFEITLEATHHGPIVSKPTMFVEIGSTEEYWKRQDAAQAIAMVVWQGLGLDGSEGVGNWTEQQKGAKVLVGIGGGHYVPRHMDVIKKGDGWVGHLLSGYSLPMQEPSSKKKEYDVNEIGGAWKQAVQVAVSTTNESFPGGTVLVHIDNKSFKGWQRTVLSQFLEQENIAVGKAEDFF